jgi:hypothetical protein
VRSPYGQRARLRRAALTNPTAVQLFDFGFGGGARRENSAAGRKHLSTNVVTSSLKRSDDLRSDPPRQARELFNLGLVHALEYGVASADLKPSTVWATTRLTVSA